jgi:DNA integrity scanning protein DisA with diadenylate cyclase activity
MENSKDEFKEFANGQLGDVVVVFDDDNNDDHCEGVISLRSKYAAALML